MKLTDQKNDSEKVFEEAAEWFHKRETGQLDTSAFEKWLLSDLRHETAYRKVEESDFELKSLRLTPEMLRLENEILLKAGHRSKSRLYPSSRRAVIAAGAAGLAGIALAGWHWATLGDVYKTAIGEQKTVLLDDGSKVNIDANSEVRASISRKDRDIRLLSGRANFVVSKDPSRAFRVLARDKLITALGTAFSVDLTADAVSVILSEGEISIGQTSQDHTTNKLIIPYLSGQKLVRLQFGTTLPSIKDASAAEELSWLSGTISFQNEALSSAAARMNNYSHVKIEIEGESARKLQVTGQFAAGRSDAFVDAVTSYFPLRAESPDKKTIVLKEK